MPKAKSAGKRRSASRTSDGDLKKRLEVLNTLLESFQDKMTSIETKPSLGDFIRLLQLQRELEAEMPKDIRVSWVDEED